MSVKFELLNYDNKGTYYKHQAGASCNTLQFLSAKIIVFVFVIVVLLPIGCLIQRSSTLFLGTHSPVKFISNWLQLHLLAIFKQS